MEKKLSFDALSGFNSVEKASKFVFINSSLFKDSVESTFWEVLIVHRYYRDPTGFRMLVVVLTAFYAFEFKVTLLQ